RGGGDGPPADGAAGGRAPPRDLPDHPGGRARAAVPAVVRGRAGAPGAGRGAGGGLPGRRRASRRVPGGGTRRRRPHSVPPARARGAPGGRASGLLGWRQALPSFFTGLRISVVYAVIGAVFGEYVGAREGLGIWMQLSQNAFRTDLVFAAILVTSALSLLLYW